MSLSVFELCALSFIFYHQYKLRSIFELGVHLFNRNKWYTRIQGVSSNDTAEEAAVGTGWVKGIDLQNTTQLKPLRNRKKSSCELATLERVMSIACPSAGTIETLFRHSWPTFVAPPNRATQQGIFLDLGLLEKDAPKTFPSYKLPGRLISVLI